MLFVYVICFHAIFIFRMRQYKQIEFDCSFNLMGLFLILVVRSVENKTENKGQTKNKDKSKK